MSFNDIINDLKNKIYKPLYLFYGEENYFIDELSNYIQKNILSESEKAFNQTVVYGKEASVTDIIEMARRYPMMSNLQVIIVKEAQDVKNFKNFEPYVAAPLASTILVFCFKNTKSIDKRLKVNSLITKNGVVFESKKLYERDAYKWINDALREANLTIEPEALQLFFESIGADVSRLANEINKLKITQTTGKIISKDDIAANIGISRDFNIFELQKALGKKDKLNVYKIISHFSKDSKNNPLIRTVSVLFSYFIKLIIVHTLKDKSRNNVASKLGISPYFSDEYVSSSRNYSLEKLTNIVSYLRETDVKLKGVDINTISESDLAKELIFKILH